MSLDNALLILGIRNGALAPWSLVVSDRGFPGCQMEIAQLEGRRLSRRPFWFMGRESGLRRIRRIRTRAPTGLIQTRFCPISPWLP